MMVSNNVRNMVWQRLLDMARYARYYERLAWRYRRLPRCSPVCFSLISNGRAHLVFRLVFQNIACRDIRTYRGAG